MVETSFKPNDPPERFEPLSRPSRDGGLERKVEPTLRRVLVGRERNTDARLVVRRAALVDTPSRRSSAETRNSSERSAPSPVARLLKLPDLLVLPAASTESTNVDGTAIATTAAAMIDLIMIASLDNPPANHRRGAS